MKKGNLSFGVQSVVAGQKSSVVNADPQLVVSCTSGKFTVTSPVTKKLGVAPGDYINFFNNIAVIDNAISSKNADLVAECEANGIDIESAEGIAAIHEAYDAWYIAKGVQLYKANGEPLMVSERFTKEDKAKFLKENAAAIVAENRDVLAERLGNPDATDEELMESLTIDDIKSPLTPKYSGSKCATTSNMTGVGLQVSFTDSNVWATLKAGVAEPEKINRVFDVDLDNPIIEDYHNGHTVVKVTMYPISFKADEAPIQRVKKD